jgi:pimeloyl-ACP methyl ester carboxylesterase
VRRETLDRPDLFASCSATCEGAGCEGQAGFVARAVGGEGLTRELLGRLVTGARKGLRPSLVCAREHVPRSTYAAWIVRGRAAVELYTAGRMDKLPIEADLVLGIDEAAAEWHASELEYLGDVDDPAIRLRLLRLRFPRLYHPTAKIHDDDDVPDPVRTSSAAETLTRRLRELDAAVTEVEREAEQEDADADADE